MKNNTTMCYSKIHLRNMLRLHKIRSEAEANQISEHISLIVETINNNKEYQFTNIAEGKTKEQLFSLGFSAGNIQNYFEFRAVSEQNSSMRWFLKTHLILNGHKIRTIKDLLNILEAENLKCAV